MVEKMKAKYDKYRENVKNMNILIFVASVLGPHIKFKFVQWDSHKFYEKYIGEILCNKVNEALHDMFNVYLLSTSNGQLTETATRLSSDVGIDDFDSPELSFAIEFERDMNLNSNPGKNEVDLYLMERLEKKSDTFDILMWWKLKYSKYPILSQIARDLLAMPVSTIALEFSFST
uniref:AC transposase n=1 Tax=Cajanus cajan TaxID=3821 RepID=A0A151TTG1_CAJCA|nr:Putative AC transposase [Cajanus cajan]